MYDDDDDDDYTYRTVALIQSSEGGWVDPGSTPLFSKVPIIIIPITIIIIIIIVTILVIIIIMVVIIGQTPDGSYCWDGARQSWTFPSSRGLQVIFLMILMILIGFHWMGGLTKIFHFLFLHFS